MLGISRGEKGYAALPGRESDFQASLSTAIEYAAAVSCPRQVRSIYGYALVVWPQYATR